MELSVKKLAAMATLVFGMSLTGCNGISAGGYFEMGGRTQPMGDQCLCRGENCACAPSNSNAANL